MNDGRMCRVAYGAAIGAMIMIVSASAEPQPRSSESERQVGPADFLVDQLSAARFKRNVVKLVSFVSRDSNQPGNTEAVNWIAAELTSYGYTNVTLDPYEFEGSTEFNIYATKMGTVEPTQMYIVSAHMDSFSFADITFAPGADDDGSGTSLVLELARVFAKTQTDISVRFMLFNNEETGLDGSRAYVFGHEALQGTLDEPTWLGNIQHDMIMYDHLAVRDADVEYQANSDFAAESMALANAVAGAMAVYGSMPAEVSDNMDFTDSKSFQNFTAAVSVRENRRVDEIGANSNPHWHQPSDVPETFNADDYAFGFNVVKMTAGAVAELVGAVPDCDMNGIPDADDITAGAADVNSDGVLDACQDCNGNQVLDPVEVADESAPDCNGNGVPDECDLALGNSDDIDGSLIPDECEPCSVSTAPVVDTILNSQGVPVANVKNRFLTFTAGDPGQFQAVRLVFDELPEPFSAWNGAALWVLRSSQVSEAGSSDEPLAGFDNFSAATLGCAPVYLDWSTIGTVHVFHEGIRPGGLYTLQVVDNSCSAFTEGNYSPPLSLETAQWGDLLENLATDPPPPPEGSVTIGDVFGTVLAFQSAPGQPHKTRADLEPRCLDLLMNISDVLADVGAFQGLPYPFEPPAEDPCRTECFHPVRP